MTDNAASEIRTLMSRPDVPDDGGLRISGGADGGLMLTLTPAPLDGDQVIDDRGARLFLEPPVGELLADKELDAAVDTQGSVQFALADQL